MLKRGDFETGNEEGNATSIPVESFFDERELHEMWPDTLLNNPSFMEGIEKRKQLINALHAIQSRILHPTASVEKYIEDQNISEELAANLYKELADLLIESPEYGRIILYLPFEYLLSTEWKPATQKLKREAERFRESYMHTWKKLLHVRDVRANFVDGDVLEVEKRTGDLPRVVKAAHLIPFLLQKQWITINDVASLYDTNANKTLRESIRDTFGVLKDLDLVDEDFLQKYGTSEENIVVSEQQEEMTQKRAKWLEEVRSAKLIEEAGDAVRLALEHQLCDTTIDALTISSPDLANQLALVDGLRKAIEKTAQEDIHSAESLYNQYRKQLLALWETQRPDVQTYLQKLFFRLYHLDIVDKQTLDSLGLSVPTIDGPFSENLQHMQAKIDDVDTMLNAMRGNPTLMEHVYPVVMLYGSRLKGYGTKDADIDLGIFVKPTTPEEMRKEVRTLLSNVLPEDLLKDPITEFWLQEKEGGLSVRDSDDHDRAAGNRLWTHVLFGAAWNGDVETMQQLYAQLLATYFEDSNEKMYGHTVRDLYLESIEKDILQYRLMHKGYERYYPSHPCLQSAQAKSMDGQSMFWDSGYRAMATKLFVEKVFLPQI